MIQLEATDLATKQIKRAEYAKHPFSKKRLRVIDSFPPAKRLKTIASDPSSEEEPTILCPSCSAPVDKIMVVESDADLSLSPKPQTAPYHVLCCSSCNLQSWYVILS